jgi:plasmid stabilization system protein ParE
VRYRVAITPRALDEIDAIVAWLFQRAPRAAARWHQALLDAVDELEDNPQRCSLAPENDWFLGGELRQMLYGKRRRAYRILFEIRGNTVYVLRVRHGAQNLLSPEDL